MGLTFKLTAKTKINALGVKLFRIEALVDIPACGVKKGDKGGWVSSERTSRGDARVSGNAWVYGDAEVFGDARVYGDAEVFGDARVSGNAWVYGDARVSGNAWVYGDAEVFGDARVSGNAWVYGDAEVSGNAWVYCERRFRFHGNPKRQNPKTTVAAPKRSGNTANASANVNKELDEMIAGAKKADAELKRLVSNRVTINIFGGETHINTI